MGITSALVLFAVVWFMTFFVVLPLRLTTQGEAGEVVPGTHKSAPADAQIGGGPKSRPIGGADLGGSCHNHFVGLDFGARFRLVRPDEPPVLVRVHASGPCGGNRDRLTFYRAARR